MSAHTPGPWRYTAGSLDCKPVVQRGMEGGFAVCGITSEREEADARLISAAPDNYAANVALLAALDEAFGIKAIHDDEYIYDTLPSSGVARGYFMARAAIAKATKP